MKIALAGAYGRLGREILKELIMKDYSVVALDRSDIEIEGIDKSKFEFRSIDVTKKESLEGLLDGVDIVISTVGLTCASATLTNYDVDYQGNLNLLNEAKKASVKHFAYISVINADKGEGVPIVNAKYLFEKELIKSGLNYVIYRPTGYFYDIVKVFKPMIEKGKVSLLGKDNHSCNVVATEDFARFIVETMCDENKMYSVGGTETYTYEEIAKMCFAAKGKQAKIGRAPNWLFSVLERLPKNKKSGKSAIIKFSKFTLTQDLVGTTIVGPSSFKEYIKENLK